MSTVFSKKIKKSDCPKTAGFSSVQNSIFFCARRSLEVSRGAKPNILTNRPEGFPPDFFRFPPSQETAPAVPDGRGRENRFPQNVPPPNAERAFLPQIGIQFHPHSQASRFPKTAESVRLPPIDSTGRVSPQSPSAPERAYCPVEGGAPFPAQGKYGIFPKRPGANPSVSILFPPSLCKKYRFFSLSANPRTRNPGSWVESVSVRHPSSVNVRKSPSQSGELESRRTEQDASESFRSTDSGKNSAQGTIKQVYLSAQFNASEGRISKSI